MQFMHACASMVVGQEQVESEAKEDEETYDKFKCWCHECCPQCWEHFAAWLHGRPTVES